jgi:sulfide:quinone oxidoreductase
MAARGIEYTKRRRVYGIDPAAKVAHFKDHDEPYDVFVGIPVHKVPDVLVEAG